MSGYAVSEHAHDDEERRPRAYGTYGYVILASLVAGIGIFLTLVWVITFQWIYLSGVVLMAIGFLLFFSPWAGPDKAE